MDQHKATMREAFEQLQQLPSLEQEQFAAWVLHVLDAHSSWHRPWASAEKASCSFKLFDALTYLNQEEQGLFATWFLQVAAVVKIQERPWISAAKDLSQQQLLGMWHNMDTSTGGLTRVHIVFDEATGWTVQGWGRCSGGSAGVHGECEWERVSLSLLGASVVDLECRHGYAVWESGFKRTTLTIELDGTTLVARLYSFFMDGSQRRDYADTVYLQRKPEAPSA